MAKQTPLIRSFNAGEWSPLMAGRIDLDKYGSSCRKMLNFLPTPQGTAVARSGTAYVVNAASNDYPSALLPFQFSTLQSCILEFGEKILRFVTNDGLLVDGNGAVYTVQTPYAASDAGSIRYAQKNDVLYLFCASYPVYKLSRYGSTDWKLEEVSFTDGPWLDINYESNHASFSASGGTVKEDFSFTATDTAATGATSVYDGTGVATWHTANATTMKGYQVVLPSNNSYTYESTIYSQKDMEPVSWVLSGSTDNTNWTVIDTQTNFVDYVNEASDWITVYPREAYSYYKLEVSAVYTASSIPPNIKDILVTSDTDTPVSIHFDNWKNINFNAGFSASDTGRLIRIERSDGTWVSFKIESVTDANTVVASVQQMPLLDATITTYWRLGLYCQTNGFPSCGVFYSERLWMGGVAQYPDTVIGSEIGAYESMAPDDPRGGTVSDSDAINITLESRSQILWMNSDDRGLVMGTSAGEWTVQSGQYTNYTTASAITPTSVLARSPTQRGSASVDAVRIDHQTLYVQRAGRQVRALAYSFQIDGYSSTSLSTQATHLGQPAINRLAYQAEPYSNVWAMREDGRLLSLTYMQDEQVQGWAQHDVSGFVESIACIPAPDSQQDTLWLVVRRTIEGRTVRYIERLLRSWDFDMEITDAAFVDCCTVDTSRQQNIRAAHLPSQNIYGVIDGKTAFGPIAASADGTFELPVVPASQVVYGLPLTAELITQRLEAGSQLGTAQGKIKRVDRVVARLWSTGAGTFGLPATVNRPEDEDYPITFDDFSGVMDTDAGVHSFDYEFRLPPGYDRDGSIKIAKRPEDLFPLNVVALTAWVDTEDSA